MLTVGSSNVALQRFSVGKGDTHPHSSMFEGGGVDVFFGGRSPVLTPEIHNKANWKLAPTRKNVFTGRIISWLFTFVCPSASRGTASRRLSRETGRRSNHSENFTNAVSTLPWFSPWRKLSLAADTLRALCFRLGYTFCFTFCFCRNDLIRMLLARRFGSAAVCES